MARLEGKIALITGAGTGIGRAAARAMAAKGASVVVAEINAAAGEQTAQIVSQAGGECIAVTTDVTQEDSVKCRDRHRRAALWRAAHPAQQRGWIDASRQHGGRGADRGVLAGDPPRSIRHVPGLPVRYTGDHRLGRGIGDQHGLERRADGGCRPRLLHRREGRHRGDHPVDGGGVRATEGAGQCDCAGRDDDRSCARAVRGRQSASHEDCGGASGRTDRTGGHRQHGGVPGVRRIHAWSPGTSIRWTAGSRSPDREMRPVPRRGFRRDARPRMPPFLSGGAYSRHERADFGCQAICLPG